MECLHDALLSFLIFLFANSLGTAAGRGSSWHQSLGLPQDSLSQSHSVFLFSFLFIVSLGQCALLKNILHAAVDVKADGDL